MVIVMATDRSLYSHNVNLSKCCFFNKCYSDIMLHDGAIMNCYDIMMNVTVNG